MCFDTLVTEGEKRPSLPCDREWRRRFFLSLSLRQRVEKKRILSLSFASLLPLFRLASGFFQLFLSFSVDFFPLLACFDDSSCLTERQDRFTQQFLFCLSLFTTNPILWLSLWREKKIWKKERIRERRERERERGRVRTFESRSRTSFGFWVGVLDFFSLSLYSFLSLSLPLSPCEKRVLKSEQGK